MLDFTQAELDHNLTDCFRVDKRPDAFNLISKAVFK